VGKRLSKLFVVLIALILLLPAIANAEWHKNYMCNSKYGPKAGYGRPSKHGEYSSYWKKKAKRGEFVIFQYKPNGKKYWFYKHKCQRIK